MSPTDGVVYLQYPIYPATTRSLQLKLQTFAQKLRSLSDEAIRVSALRYVMLHIESALAMRTSGNAIERDVSHLGEDRENGTW
jgi:hypothetical protein